MNRDGNAVLRLPADPLGGEAGSAWSDYVLCRACGSLTIEAIPQDMGAYYAGVYYSHTTGPAAGLRGLAQRLKDADAIFDGMGLVGRLAGSAPYVRIEQLRRLRDGTVGTGLTRGSAILDVGCGNGTWLRRLAAIGFRDLTGCDPFLREPDPEGRPRLLACDVTEVEGRFDLVVCSHALEHMPDPGASLAAMRDRLAPGGFILVRVPLLNGYAWTRFGGDWVQLDAPRHFTLPTVAGMTALSRRAGLSVVHAAFDATPFMVLGSLARAEGALPHTVEGRAVLHRIERAHGAEAARIARETNALGTSDQASFFLKPDAS